MVIASDYPFLDILGTMLVLFGFVVWFWLLIRVFSDIFRRHDVSGWVKFAWCVFVFVLPLLGVLIYLIVHGKEMGERDVEQAQAAQAQFDDYVRSVGGNGGPAGEIEKAKRLLESGDITQAEFDAIKSKAVTA
jgi:phospholipase D-like protein/putative oligomerization/nucleic acid binding protein